MRHTVIGLFNTYTEADSARNTLVQTGFSHNDVELQANPETPPAADDESPGVLANIERFFSSLFSTSGADAPAAEHYRNAVRRGAVVVCVNASSEAHAELAHNTLKRLGAIDVGERSRGWEALEDDDDVQTRREHSMLDELGIGGTAAVPTATQPPREPLRAAEEAREWARMEAPPHDTPIDDASRAAIAAGSAPGSGAVLRPDLADTARVPPVDYPATTIQGAAGYQSDPSEIGRTSAAPHGQYQSQRSMPPIGRGAPATGATDDFGADADDRARAVDMSDDYRTQTQMQSQRSVPPVDYPSGAPSGFARAPAMPDEDQAIRAAALPPDYSSPTLNPGASGRARFTEDTFDAGVGRVSDRPDDYLSPQRASAADVPATSPGVRAGDYRPAAGESGWSDSSGGGLGAPIPDEFLEYEEDFRTHYHEEYGTSAGARYDEYVPAYRYGASMGRDMRYQDRPWDDVEPEARQDWERTSPEGSWERFKAAVKHGWERVTGHHHHHH
ncbi:MAG TPA: hypothetical protein VGL08_21230 [Paraburkholderia sp.]|jgi:hypothetical protein